MAMDESPKAPDALAEDGFVPPDPTGKWIQEQQLAPASPSQKLPEAKPAQAVSDSTMQEVMAMDESPEARSALAEDGFVPPDPIGKWIQGASDEELRSCLEALVAGQPQGARSQVNCRPVFPPREGARPRGGSRLPLARAGLRPCRTRDAAEAGAARAC
mmetsp:Transcript_96479/g.256336  ORF Transcript_96479/g.256336 Transcript_96479/m.256336 type:complete len:159 (-) Transcript_96479:199-675(-)